MTREEAKKHLTTNPDAEVFARDVNHANSRATGERFSVWLEDGELVHRHPTDPRGPVVVSRFDEYHD